MRLIYLIAGEASGDALGAGLMKAMQAEHPDMVFAGVGGDAMIKAGFQSLFSYSELSVMGFWEILPSIPKFLKLLRLTERDIATQKPDVVVTIDSPGFNFRLASMLKKNPVTASIKRIHYVAPSVWAYKPQRAAKAAQLFDKLLCVLPFEPPYFEKEGLSSVFVGHPVLWKNRKGNDAALRIKYRLAANEQVLLILPGSRIGEVKRHLPVFLEAAKAIVGIRLVVLAGSQVKDYIRSHLPKGAVLCDIDDKYDAFAAASMALSKSGTVTLELAVYGVPMVVAHKVNALSAWLLRKMILIPYVSLVNIAAGKAIIPELLQEKCNVPEIVSALKLLQEPGAMEQQRSDYEAAKTILRGGNTQSPDVLAARSVFAAIT